MDVFMVWDWTFSPYDRVQRPSMTVVIIPADLFNDMTYQALDQQGLVLMDQQGLVWVDPQGLVWVDQQGLSTL